jgi:hypothetical protein
MNGFDITSGFLFFWDNFGAYGTPSPGRQTAELGADCAGRKPLPRHPPGHSYKSQLLSLWALLDLEFFPCVQAGAVDRVCGGYFGYRV